MSKFFQAFQQTEPTVANAVFTDHTEQPKPHSPTDLLALPSDIQSEIKTDAPPPVRHLPPAVADHREARVRVLDGSPLLPFDGADEAAAEHYRIIRTRIVHHERKPTLICVSSASMGDGKSVNSINIAGALALKHETKVLLLDCDFRRSTLAKTLGLPQSPGLSEILAGTIPWEDAVVRIAEAPNLHFIPAGALTSAPAELLDSPRWKAICELFRKTFSFVIMDSPPIGKVADFDLIKNVCDGILMIVREGHSDRKLVLKALEELPKDKLMGVVMNCVQPWFLGKGENVYGSYYGPDIPPQKQSK